jgi:TPR repeat protein
MIRGSDAKKSNDAPFSEYATPFRAGIVLVVLLLILPLSFGCQQKTPPAGSNYPRLPPLPVVWTASSTTGCDLERIWTHSLDHLADLTEADLAACKAGCQHEDGAACVGAGLLLYSGVTIKQNKALAQELFRYECDANLFAGCVSLWMTYMDDDLAQGQRSHGARGLFSLDKYCLEGERHACEAAGNHFYKRIQTSFYPWELKTAVHYQNIACDRGSLSACASLGWLYLSGDGVKKDEKKAADIIEPLCQRGHALSCGMLADMYQDGLGVPEDVEKATELYRRSCEAGVLSSCYQYAHKFWNLDDDDDEAHHKMAVAYFEKACQGGLKVGCLETAVGYLNGIGVTADHGRAVQYYDIACDRGVAVACSVLGGIFERGEQVTEDARRAAQYFERSCTYRDSSSCNKMGHYHLDGYGVKQNDNIARLYFDQACFNDEAEACYQMARMQAHGIGGFQNETMALRNMQTACFGHITEACNELDFHNRYRRFRPLADGHTAMILLEACHQGNMRACYDLGMLYHNEESNVIVDMQAMVVFQKACDGGINEACAEIGNAYVDGRGVTQDVAKGVKLVDDACHNHCASACYSLGIRYRDGDGVDANEFKAILLLDDACVKLPEACEETEALRAHYKAVHEPAISESPPAASP